MTKQLELPLDSSINSDIITEIDELSKDTPIAFDWNAVLTLCGLEERIKADHDVEKVKHITFPSKEVNDAAKMTMMLLIMGEEALVPVENQVVRLTTYELSPELVGKGSQV